MYATILVQYRTCFITYLVLYNSPSHFFYQAVACTGYYKVKTQLIVHVNKAANYCPHCFQAAHNVLLLNDI